MRKNNYSIKSLALWCSLLSSYSIAYAADVTCSSGSYTISGGDVFCKPSAAGDNIVINQGDTVSVTGGVAVGSDGTSVGTVTNNGTINSTGRGFSGIGITLNGDTTVVGIINKGEINSENMGIDIGGFQSSPTTGNEKIVVTGFDGASVNLAGTRLVIYNEGAITTNPSSTFSSIGINIAGNTELNGSIYNKGTIDARYDSISISTSAILHGSITNTGSISSAIGVGIFSSGQIDNDIDNQGTVIGTTGIKNNEMINGNIINTGSIQGTDDEGIDNYGTISGVIQNSGDIQGNTDGIVNKGTINQLNNAGTISGNNAITTDTGTFTNGINNYGVLEGNVLLGENTLNLFAQTSSSGPALAVKGDISGDALSVINLKQGASFTTEGNANVGKINIDQGSTLTLSDNANWQTIGGVINAGTIKFSDTTNTATLGTDASGAFYNSGIIDLTAKNASGQNNLAGSVLTINGNYVSGGGSILLNTLLDDATSNSGQGTSDLINITGNATTGAGGATKLFITPTANSPSLGQLTVGNGIKVVDVQGSVSQSNAFSLGRALAQGNYEYVLKQTDGNWYLSSFAKGPNPSNPNSPNANQILYNPSIGAYLANQTAAVQMFQQTLFDRLISSSEVTNDASKQLFWLRTQLNHGSYNTSHDSFSNRTRSYMAQMGGDLHVWTLNNGGYFHLGLMAGYGDFKDTSKSRSTGTKADGKVKGYSTGIYGTYFANQDTNIGLYADLWSQMGWYRNEISGQAQIGTKKYNSTVWSNSIELGYGFTFAKSGEYEWLVTPQAQLTYNYYDADNQRDKNLLRTSNRNASGLDTRLGMRFHARGIDKSLIEPFLEVNWLDTTAKNKINFNGDAFKDGYAKDRLEAKLGLQGNINNRFSASVQVGGQWGNNSFNSYQGQLNLNYKF